GRGTPAAQRGRTHESTGCEGMSGGGGSAGPCGKGGSTGLGTWTSALARGTSGSEYACVEGCACADCAGGAAAWVITPFSRSRIMMTLSLPLVRSLVTWLALTWILMWCWPLASSLAVKLYQPRYQPA